MRVLEVSIEAENSRFYPHPPWRNQKRQRKATTEAQQECGLLGCVFMIFVFALPSLFISCAEISLHISSCSFAFQYAQVVHVMFQDFPFLFQYVRFNVQHCPSENRKHDQNCGWFFPWLAKTQLLEGKTWPEALTFLLREPLKRKLFGAKNKARTCSQCLESIHAT